MSNLDDLPPPAYTEQEFDQKTSHAIALSAHHPQNNRPNEDEWEVWDEAVFEANASVAQAGNQGSSAGSSSVDRRPSSSRRPLPTPGRPSSGLPAVQPLRIHKRNKSSGDSNDIQNQLKRQEATSGWPQKGSKASVTDADEPQNDVSPPPPFQDVEPLAENVVTLSYNPSDSLPPSPLMPTIPEHQTPLTPQQAQPFPPQQTYPQQSYPQPTFAQQAYSQQTFTQQSYPQQTFHHQTSPAQSYTQPETTLLNPVVNIYPHRISTPPSAPARASPSQQYYQQPTRTFTPPTQPPQAKPHLVPPVMTSIPPLQNRGVNSTYEPPKALSFDASAFYNPAVSAHVPSSIPSTRPRQSQYVPSNISSNYNPGAHQPRVLQSTLYPPAQNQQLTPLRAVQSTTQLRPQTAYNFSMQPTPPSSSGWNSNLGTTPHRWATSEQDFAGT